MAIELNANNRNDVSNPHKVAVLTAEPNTWLLIYSGIAYQRQRAQGSTGFLGFGEHTSTTTAEVHVKLDNISAVLLQSAATAGMSNILEEDTWGQWIIDFTGLELRNNGDLVLNVNTSVTGEGDAEFYAFSYHVEAKVVLDEASIAGTIRWPLDLATPFGQPLFLISAYSEFQTAIPGMFPSIQRITEATGQEAPISETTTTFEVPYKITGALLGK